jgi:hypothetical protein
MKDVPVMIGEGFLAYTVSFPRGLKEGMPFMIEGRRKKGEMAG